MMAYLRLGRLCALHVEWAIELSVWPHFAFSRYGSESIIDLPYCRIIYTPGMECAGPRTSGKQDKTETRRNERERQRVSCSAAGSPEN